MPRHVPIVLALTPFTLLAACGGSSEPAAPIDEATTAAPAVAAAAAPVAATPISYDCLPAQRLTASYDNSGTTSEATLTLDGKIYELFATPAASGVRYVSEEGRTPGKTLIWFTKGDDGTLYEGNVGGSEADETKLAECSPSDAAG
jgi:membrane-bound inhibitor of C-type lysozyme